MEVPSDSFPAGQKCPVTWPWAVGFGGSCLPCNAKPTLLRDHSHAGPATIAAFSPISPRSRAFRGLSCWKISLIPQQICHSLQEKFLCWNWAFVARPCLALDKYRGISVAPITISTAEESEALGANRACLGMSCGISADQPISWDQQALDPSSQGLKMS